MAHLSPDRLADSALGIDDPLTAAEQNHLVSCAECRNELGELSRIADLGRQPEHVAAPHLVPTDAIWQSVQAQLAGQSNAATPTETSAEPPPSPPTIAEQRRTPRRRSWFVVAAAAVLGLIIGAGITTVAVRDRAEVTSSTALEALPGQTGQGTAEVVRDGGVLS